MKPVSIDYISPENKISRLSSLLARPWAMLLDSCGQQSHQGRFDIFCFEPLLKLSFENGTSHLTFGQLGVPDLTQDLTQGLSLNDPLDCMRQILTRIKSITPQNNIAPKTSATDSQLPFCGGWLGYLSYDFGRQLETMPNLTRDEINLPLIKMGLYQWAMITDHKARTTKLYNFGLAQVEWLKIITAFLSRQTTDPILPTAKLTSNWQAKTSKDEYLNAFDKIQDYIQNGDCYQVNYAQQFSADFSGSAQSLYAQLSQVNQAPYSAFLNFEDFQILSLSPERFIHAHHRKVITQPIKGTRPRSPEPAEDNRLAESLINSEKDRSENLMIVDLMRNDLSRTASRSSVKVSELFGHYAFESVHHLISTVESQLAPEFDVFDLLATTFPGGSITGAPKIRAMEIIEELEPTKRNIYCGSIVYIDFEMNMDSNICIRTLVAKQNKLYAWAGGGIVADSNVDDEYRETFDKLAKILPVLQTDFCVQGLSEHGE